MRDEILRSYNRKVAAASKIDRVRNRGYFVFRMVGCFGDLDYKSSILDARRLILADVSRIE